MACHNQRGVAVHGAPHLVALGAEPATHLQRIRTPSLHLDLLRMAVLQHARLHRLQGRRLFFPALIPVLGLTCHTRAVSPLPLAFMALSTIGCLTSGAWPASLSSSRKGRPRRAWYARHRE